MKASSMNLVPAGAIAAVLFTLIPGAFADSADHDAYFGQDAKAKLGMRLFFDQNLSSPPGQACATCHSPSVAFTDPDRSLPVSKGVIQGRIGTRNAPTVMYAAFTPSFGKSTDENGEELISGGLFLDGRAATLEEQAKGPFLNALEMNNPDKKSVVEKVRAIYEAEFQSLFGADVFLNVDQAFDRIAEAIAAFERTSAFSPFSSKYDDYLAGRAQLTATEMRGLKIFEDPKKGNCAACHPSQLGPQGEAPLFTDFTYDNLGVPMNPFLAASSSADSGLAATTKNPDDAGKFKVPTLRNIAITGPYGHNGYFQTLRGIVEFYNSRDTRPACRTPFTQEADALAQHCWPRPETSANVNREELGNLQLSDQEIDDLVEFLGTLTDGWSR